MKLLPAFTISAVLFTFLAVSPLSAQKLNFKKGDFKALKGESRVNVEFVYDTSVGKFDKEADYVAEKVAEKNKDEKGSGDAWKVNWEADRKERFEPKFYELFNERSETNGFEAFRFDDAKYTFIIKTTHLEPGWNVGVMRRSAHINVEITLVETASRDKILGKAIMEKVPGRDAFGYDFDTGYRIQEAYALTGKILVKYLMKKVFK